MVAAGAHDLQRVHIVQQLDAVGPHSGGGAGDLVNGLALQAQRGQIGAHLHGSCCAVHDLVHHGPGFLPGKVLLRRKGDNRFFNHCRIPPNIKYLKSFE